MTFYLYHRCKLIREHGVGQLSKSMGQILQPHVGSGPYSYQGLGRCRPSWVRLYVFFVDGVYFKGGCYEGMWSWFVATCVGFDSRGVDLWWV